MSQYVSQIMRKEDSEILPVEDLNLRDYKFFVLKWIITKTINIGGAITSSAGHTYTIINDTNNRIIESGTIPDGGITITNYVSDFDSNFECKIDSTKMAVIST